MNKSFPPVLLDIILEFHPIWAIIIYSAKAVINLAGWENVAIFLAMGNDLGENILWFGTHTAKVIINYELRFKIYEGK